MERVPLTKNGFCLTILLSLYLFIKYFFILKIDLSSTIYVLVMLKSPGFQVFKVLSFVLTHSF